ncbi:MAG: hypothetical protein ACOYZ7_18580 [Chloroflexota bacterium]
MCQEIIPVKDAARKYGIPVEALTRLVHDGIIKLARIWQRGGVITVSAPPPTTAWLNALLVALSHHHSPDEEQALYQI